MRKFLIYAYCREDGTFYYIGKGDRRRAYTKRKVGVNPPKDKSKILFLHENLSEKTAFEYERRLIEFYGRKDLGTGLLRNMTDGGEGVSGWIPDDKWRKNKSESMRGENNPFFGKTHSPEVIQHLAARNREKPFNKDLKWANNGRIEIRLLPSELPEGFVIGRLFVPKNAKPVEVTNLITGEVFLYKSLNGASPIFGVSNRTIKRNIKGECSEYKGYRIKYISIDEYLKRIR